MSVFLTVRGNLGQTITLKSIQTDRNGGESNQVLTFSVASSRYKRQNVAGKDQLVPVGPTEWVNCEYWNRRAEHLSKVLAKGMPVTVEGEEITELYTHKDTGQEVKARKIRVEKIYLNLDSERIETITLKPPRQAAMGAADTDVDDSF